MKLSFNTWVYSSFPAWLPAYPIEYVIKSLAHIGQTGKTVRPKLYIGCGVSGATHHIFGMKNSDFIIAINKDPKAPMLRIADIAIVSDLFEVVPQLIEKLKSVEVVS